MLSDAMAVTFGMILVIGGGGVVVWMCRPRSAPQPAPRPSRPVIDLGMVPLIPVGPVVAPPPGPKRVWIGTARDGVLAHDPGDSSNYATRCGCPMVDHTTRGRRLMGVVLPAAEAIAQYRVRWCMTCFPAVPAEHATAGGVA